MSSRGPNSKRSPSCASRNDLLVITDEPYEYIVYQGEHIPIATLPGMRQRTVTISSLSKTFSCTGWRLGYAIASPEHTGAIRKVHDFLTVGAPAPLQEAAAIGYRFGDEYYAALAAGYRDRRAVLGRALERGRLPVRGARRRLLLFCRLHRDERRR